VHYPSRTTENCTIGVTKLLRDFSHAVVAKLTAVCPLAQHVQVYTCSHVVTQLTNHIFSLFFEFTWKLVQTRWRRSTKCCRLFICIIYLSIYPSI